MFLSGKLRTTSNPKFLINMETAFSARFRFKEKDQKGNSKAPDKSLIVDFTPEEAKKAAKWLMNQATEAELGGSTIRQYKGKNSFDEVPGFTLWGSYWSGNEGGKIEPQG